MLDAELLVSYIISQLVDDDESFDVSTLEGEGSYVISVDVKKDQIGKVIGKQGRIAKAIRSLLRAYGMERNMKIMLEINEM